jgi:glycerol-3-phosphate dehydrogenase
LPVTRVQSSSVVRARQCHRHCSGFKIIHSGVRYPQDAVTHLDIHQYQVAKKALRERIRMLHNAPVITLRPEKSCLAISTTFFCGT